jgi:hypothetical protein
MPLRTRVAVRLLAPLVFLLGVFGLAALRGRVVHTLAFLAIEDGPHCLLTGSKAGSDIEQVVRVDQWALPKLAHKVPVGRTLEKGMHDLRLSYDRELDTTLGEAPYEVQEGLTRVLSARP